MPDRLQHPRSVGSLALCLKLACQRGSGAAPLRADLFADLREPARPALCLVQIQSDAELLATRIEGVCDRSARQGRLERRQVRGDVPVQVRPAALDRASKRMALEPSEQLAQVPARDGVRGVWPQQEGQALPADLAAVDGQVREQGASFVPRQGYPLTAKVGLRLTEQAYCLWHGDSLGIRTASRAYI